MLSWIDKFRPGNKTTWVVFDEESEFSGPWTSTLSLDQVFVEENVPYKVHLKHIFSSILVFSFICSGGYCELMVFIFSHKNVGSLKATVRQHVKKVLNFTQGLGFLR